MSKTQNLDANIRIGAVLDGAIKNKIGVVTSGLSQIGDKMRDVQREQRRIGQERDALLKTGAAVDHLDREYDQLGDTLRQLERHQRNWNRVAGASRRVGAAWSDLRQDVTRTSRAVVVGGAAIGAAMFGVTSRTAEAAKEVSEFSQLAQTSPETFQRWAAAARTVGIEQDKLGDIFKDFNEKLGEYAQIGAGGATDFFEQIAPKFGITIEDFEGLDGAEAFKLYFDTLERAKLSTSEMSFYLESMGSDSTALIPLLLNSAEALEALGDRAEATGQILTDETIERAKDFRAALTDMQGAARGVQYTLGSAFMPTVTRVMGRAADAVAENRDAVSAWAEDVADRLEGALPQIGELASGVGTVTGHVWEMTEAAATAVGGFENLGLIIGGAFALNTAAKVGRFAASVWTLGKAVARVASVGRALPLVAAGVRAIGLAFAANPIGAAITAIAIGGTLIYKNWDSVGGYLGETLNDIGGQFEGLSTFVGGVFSGDMKQAGDGLGQVWDSTRSILTRNIGVIGAGFKWVYETLIRPVTDALGITDNIEAAWNKAGEILGTVWDGLGTAATGVGDIVGTVIGAIAGTDTVQSAWQTTKDTLEPLLTWIGEKFSAVGDIIKPVIDALKWGLDNGASAARALGDLFGGGSSFNEDEYNAGVRESATVTARPEWMSDEQWATAQQIGVENRQRASGGVPMQRPGYVPTSSSPEIRPQVQERRLGGAFAPGWLLTGESGPELRYENRSGYVADRRSLGTLADLADRARDLVGGVLGRDAPIVLEGARDTVTSREISDAPAEALGNGLRVALEAGRGAVERVHQLIERERERIVESRTAERVVEAAAPTVNQYITNTINAAGLSAEQLMRELERQRRHAAAGALVDNPGWS